MIFNFPVVWGYDETNVDMLIQMQKLDTGTDSITNLHEVM